MLGYKQPS